MWKLKEVKGEMKMIFKRNTYRIKPEKLIEINNFFHTNVYPVHIKNGAKLIGRWVNETKDEILVIWEYRSTEHYGEDRKSN